MGFARLFEGWHLLILLLVVIVLFGGKRLPDAARGLGRSLRIFKSEVKEMQDEDKSRRKPDTSAASEALEGRVVDGEVRGTAPTEQRRDA